MKPGHWPHLGGVNYLYADGHVKWLRPLATLGKNPVTGAPKTGTANDLQYPNGPWTIMDDD